MPNATPHLDRQPVKACFSELRTHHDAFEQFVGDSFSQLDDLASNLEQYQGNLEKYQGNLEQYQGDLHVQSEELERQRVAFHKAEEKQLETLTGRYEQQVQELQRELEAAQTEAATLERRLGDEDAQRDDAIREKIDALSDDRQVLQEELESTLDKLSALSAAADELDQLRSKHVKTQAELETVRQQFDITSLDLAAEQQRSTQIVRERADLESELDAVRARAADLSDALDESKRQMDQERAEWSVELKRMRKVLERHADMLSTKPAASNGSTTAASTAASVAASAVPPDSHGSREAEPSADPVLGSVMAQFERVRRERAKRRPSTAEATEVDEKNETVVAP